jgi:glycosyltransferase involved in cell wall biosynthesis
MLHGQGASEARSPQIADYAAISARRDPASDTAARPKVSVITVCRNARATIGRAIDSVHAQSFPDIEHIIVDGASDDGTQEYVAKRLRPQDCLISEKDGGISDAFNKGVALARGEFVQILNADDWLSEDQIEVALEVANRTGADFVFGDLIFYERGEPSFRYCGDPDYAGKLRTHLPAMNHPTVLARRAAYEKIGLFSREYQCAMEYDWFLRLHQTGARGVHDGRIVCHMTHEGVSNRRFARTLAEVRQISVKYGRSALAARFDEVLRLVKVRASFLVRGRSERIYRFVRRTINPSYKSL